MTEHGLKDIWKDCDMVAAVTFSFGAGYGLYHQMRAWGDLKSKHPALRPVLLLQKYVIAVAEGRTLNRTGLEALAEIEVEPRDRGTRRQRRTFATRLQKSYRRTVKRLDEGRVLLSSVRPRKPMAKDTSVKITPSALKVPEAPPEPNPGSDDLAGEEQNPS